MNPPVYTYTAAEAGLFVNSYLLETGEGVVAVDGSLLVSDSRAFRARLDALRKPLLGVFVTHAHPDHFNGITELARGIDAPVYATPDVKRVIEEIADDKRRQWGPTYGAEWPAETRYPDAVIEDGASIVIGGCEITAHELGPCESHAEAVFVVRPPEGRGFAFIGDLAYNGMHAYNADGHSGRWIEALDLAHDLLAGVDLLYPGHGAPGGHELLDAQRRYQLMLRESVRNLAGRRDSLDTAAVEELTWRLERFLPGAPLSWLVGLSAGPVAAELAAERAVVS